MVREGQQIDVVGLTKAFGGLVAVDDLTFSVRPGVVTGFLGPNGSGKTTTLRCVLGLLHPTSGSTAIGGVPYRELPDPPGPGRSSTWSGSARWPTSGSAGSASACASGSA